MGKSIATYSYVALNITPAATATDVLTLTGVSGRKITISDISISGTATANSIYDFLLIKRSAVNTGGTATNPTATKMDSIDPTAAGILSLYTANPTLGASAGIINGGKLYLPAGATPASAGTQIYQNFGIDGSKEPVIRGGEVFAFNFNGAAVPAGTTLIISITWTEE